MPADEIFTIGHSTHELGVFLALLERRGIDGVADVRAHPGSRRMPHFAAEALAGSLAGEGIEYRHLPELGGRRRALPDSPSAGWENDSFRGYADHMSTPEFESGLQRLEAFARERRVAVMCAEGLWWRCHRRLIADALTAWGWRVSHVLPDGTASTHELTPFAAIDAGRLHYPPPQASLDL